MSRSLKTWKDAYDRSARWVKSTRGSGDMNICALCMIRMTMCVIRCCLVTEGSLKKGSRSYPDREPRRDSGFLPRHLRPHHELHLACLIARAEHRGECQWRERGLSAGADGPLILGHLRRHGSEKSNQTVPVRIKARVQFQMSHSPRQGCLPGSK